MKVTPATVLAEEIEAKRGLADGKGNSFSVYEEQLILRALKAYDLPSEAVERDAARYRWLRDQADPDEGHPAIRTHEMNSWGKWYYTYDTGESADSKIDAAMSAQSDTSQPFSVEDGYGNGWECPSGKPEGQCGLEVVRPGKVQCDKCDPRYGDEER